MLHFDARTITIDTHRQKVRCYLEPNAAQDSGPKDQPYQSAPESQNGVQIPVSQHDN